MEKEAAGCLARLISFDLAGCTSVHDVDKFPLKSLWRIHHQQSLYLRHYLFQPLRQRILQGRSSRGRVAGYPGA